MYREYHGWTERSLESKSLGFSAVGTISYALVVVGLTLCGSSVINESLQQVGP
jgi:hypothetical protein